MVRRKVIAPAWAVTRSSAVGSGITATSPVTPARIAASIPPPPSSSEGTVTNRISPPSSTPACRLALATARTAARPAITPPFMSTAPRPYSSPPTRVGVQGGDRHSDSSPTGTTSTWPRTIARRPPGRPVRPMTTGKWVRSTSLPGQSGSRARVRGSGSAWSTTKPESTIRPAITAWTASSAPVTLGTARIVRSSRSTRAGSTASTAACSRTLRGSAWPALTRSSRARSAGSGRSGHRIR